MSNLKNSPADHVAEGLSKSEVEHLGHLARMSLTEEEIARYSSQLTNVVEYVDQLQELDLPIQAGARGVTGLSNVVKADLPREKESLANLEFADAQAGFPLSSGRLIEVRAVLGGEVEG